MSAPRLLTLLCALPLLCGCLTVELVRWAKDPLTTGEAVGVRLGENEDYVLYDFESEDGSTNRCAFVVPRDWERLPRTTWTAGRRGELTVLRDPLGCDATDIPHGLPRRRIRFIDHRLTLGRAVVSGGSHPFYGTARWKDPGAIADEDYNATEFAIVRFTDRRPDGRREVHELYAYDPQDYRWVRIGSVDIGRQRANVPARITATLLFLPALVLDIVGVIIVALEHDQGRDVDLPIGMFRRTPPGPVPFAARGTPGLDDRGLPSPRRRR